MTGKKQPQIGGWVTLREAIEFAIINSGLGEYDRKEDEKK